MEVKFYDYAEDSLLKFAVIIAESDGKLVLCKHRNRNSWEIAGGHRENGETISQCGERELKEETGAADYHISPVCVYSVTGVNSVNKKGDETFGMLYYAEVFSFEKQLHHEIEKIALFDQLPDNLTYPLIQPALLKEYQRRKLSEESGIGRCGLACFMCSENGSCNGCMSEQCPDRNWCINRKCSMEKGLQHCFECEEDCRKGLLAKIKPYGFNLFVKRYGLKELISCLKRNEQSGIIYHKEGVIGDYDDFDDVEKLLHFIKNGKKC